MQIRAVILSKITKKKRLDSSQFASFNFYVGDSETDSNSNEVGFRVVSPSRSKMSTARVQVLVHIKFVTTTEAGPRGWRAPLVYEQSETQEACHNGEGGGGLGSPQLQARAWPALALGG